MADPGRGGKGDRPPPRRLVRHSFFHQFSLTRLFLPSRTLKPVLPFQCINCSALSSPVMQCMKKSCLYPLSQYFLVLAYLRLWKMGRFVTVFLMWSETVSPINLQTLKSILNFPPQRDLTPLCVPSVCPCSQYLWIRH